MHFGNCIVEQFGHVSIAFYHFCYAILDKLFLVGGFFVGGTSHHAQFLAYHVSRDHALISNWYNLVRTPLRMNFHEYNN